MGLVRRADADEYARDAIVLDLGNLEARGDALVDQARVSAQKILADAQAERQRLLSDAHQVGHAEGYDAGRATGLNEGREAGRQEAMASFHQAAEAITQSWSEALEAFTQARARLIADAHEDLLILACDIARRATGRIIELEPELVANQMAEVLALTHAQSRLRVRVHPEDRALMADALPGLLRRCSSETDVVLEDDPDLARGSCVACTERHGVLDASVQTKLARLIEVILPNHGETA